MGNNFTEALKEVDGLTDALGMPVDEGIKGTVAALRLQGFPTRSSCEGHIGRGLPYPWVEVGESVSYGSTKSTDPEVKQLQQQLIEIYQSSGKFDLYCSAVSRENGRRHAFDHSERRGIRYSLIDDDPRKEELKQQNKEHQARILKLLAQFYSRRKAEYADMIVLEYIGSDGGFRLLGLGGGAAELLDENSQRERLKVFQDEMVAFGEFLIAHGSM